MQRLRIARGCAEGLQYLHTASHTKPLVHRDVKTSNILLDNRDEPKVGRWTLATIEGSPVIIDTPPLLKIIPGYFIFSVK